jgi:adenylate cyclase
MRMLTAVSEFNAEHSGRGYDPIIINMGINTGNIIVGNVGSERQKNYTAIGDPVNLASRLKGLNPFYHTQIIISEYTYDLIKEDFMARELDLTRVKGKLKPVRIYELMEFR